MRKMLRSDMRIAWKTLRYLASIILLIGFGVLVALVTIETGLRLFAGNLPDPKTIVYTMYLEPHPVVGWIHPVDFNFRWEGANAYCVEFDALISMNNLGFRDAYRETEKPEDTVRIAILGDSFVEALQVQDEQTAVRILESRLRSELGSITNQHYEVMNFGVSNFSVGQYLMLYNEIVRDFRPDYVFFFASYVQMSRTPISVVPENFTNTPTRVQARPIYTIDNGTLIYVPAAEYDIYVEKFNVYLSELDSTRGRIVEPINASPSAIINWLNLRNYVRLFENHPTIQERNTDTIYPDVELNYLIIEELNRQVNEDGGQLIMIDAFEYFEAFGAVPGSGILVDRNISLAQEIGMGHINLSEQFRKADERVLWLCDGHLNVAGNRIMGDTLFEWFDANIVKN